jgi:hypothetical protein
MKWKFRIRKKKKEEEKIKDDNTNRCALCKNFSKTSSQYGYCNDMRIKPEIYFAYTKDNNKINIMVPKFGVCKYFKKK